MVAFDLSVDLMSATVQLEQPLPGGVRTVGTGFLLSDPGPDGRARTILVTAGHVLDKMDSPQIKIGYRFQGEGGVWRYDPQNLTIRAPDGKGLWTKHPSRDVAVMQVDAPPAFAKAALPISALADEDSLAKDTVRPGAEMMALGFPRGLAANGAGFPILRAGRVASYPLGPASAVPTFLLDFSVFPGNSGGPVFMTDKAGQGGLITGLLTQQVQLNNERLEIGVVTQARYVREAVAMLDGVKPPPPSTLAQMQPASAVAVNAVDYAGAE